MLVEIPAGQLEPGMFIIVRADRAATEVIDLYHLLHAEAVRSPRMEQATPSYVGILTAAFPAFQLRIADRVQVEMIPATRQHVVADKQS